MLDRAWRVAATGLAFATLFVGGFLLAVTVIPAATLLARDPAVRARRAQHIVRTSFRAYMACLRTLGLVRLEVSGAERLAAMRGRLVVSNHPTLLDVVLIMSLVPRAQCVVKHQLWAHPLLGPLVRAAGYIRNDLEPEAFIAQCREHLAAGNNLIIFPEGTRSVPGRPVRFQRGFAHVATMTGVNLQLIKIGCNPITLFKGEPWYRVPERVPRFRVEVEDVLDIEPFLREASRPAAARRLVAHLERHYSGLWQHG
jgi:1-acyl-sn-glycerol-3-phosphate acyltransferase